MTRTFELTPTTLDATATPVTWTPEETTVQAEINGRQYTLQLQETAPGQGWLILENRVLPYEGVWLDDEHVALWVAGRHYTFQVTDAARQAPRRQGHGGAAAGGGGGQLKSPMPGTVLKVLVQPGETVAEGQPLVVMESMKMEMTLSAGQAGTVKAVHCEAGRMVELGALLVEVEGEM